MPQQADILLVTATEIETAAVFAAFRAHTKTQERIHQVADRSYFELGKVHNQSIWLLRCQMGSGGIGASLQEVSKAIEALRPGAAIMVGIAMGFNKGKHGIGDVLVSRKLTLYEQRRIGTEEIVRGDRATAAGLLINRFENAKSMWRPDPKVEVRPGLLLTGEKLIDDVPFRTKVQNFEPEAVGAEMEGSGLYVACVDAGVPWIVVKAICDWGDGNKGRKKAERQTLAATNAATFVLFALSLAPLISRDAPISGAAVAHLYWLGSDLADAFRHTKDGEPVHTAAKCVSQAARHFRKAGFRQKEIEDGLAHLANVISQTQPHDWAQQSVRHRLALAVNDVKGQVNIFVRVVAGAGFDPDSD
ncbi:MAG TPA: hypothetical protein VGD81_17785 [Opitutaceae bacterium]